ncbi:hypothetical protein PF005_g21808 [Phytophthora fragariae]|uniref:Uncharacterized protein n=1 Tax=Phytophthora fragariae TaxID=53985 RepID=A0A6A3QWG6_9STRA|nr:hypothetical protein PF003_g27530 [Phytophthora fragariae]KAE8927012.1 hypothetical protein PF009_g22811 [Phytophthora fragariae]KAE8981324.1 hypothetical protein PF011_g22066 [Phytophthora fragariae]KAE9084221.1 hypothetical protein PF007_g21597 [Phytophthora fragariae]KAE9087388.1 hypothetical protein PF010_g19746 [Phytophthora fragariae]
MLLRRSASLSVFKPNRALSSTCLLSFAGWLRTDRADGSGRDACCRASVKIQ